MEKLLENQTSLLESIKQIERNFNKDSASRKTREYLDDRLNKLDRLWAEFRYNNEKLAIYEDIKYPYFAQNQFQKTKEYFDSVRNKIESFTFGESLDYVDKTGLPGPSKTPQTLPSASRMPSPSTVQHSGQVVELLSLQRTNFRAFKRLVTGMDVDKISDKWELEDELKNVQCRWKAIDSLHLQIDNLLQGSDSNYDDEFYYYENSYKLIKRKLNYKLASAAHLQQSTPQLDIPIFTGKYTQWPTFYDLFCEAIHNNNLLTKCQKMQHLKGKLKGEAERLVQHLHISADNYDTAWELLVHRYNNPQLLFTNHIETFLSQPVMQKQTASDIKRLYDTSMESIRAIQNLGIDTTTWDPLLVHHICKKLDQLTLADYKESRKSPRELPLLVELMEFLESKFTALEPIQRRERDNIVVGKSQSYQHSMPNLKQNRIQYPISNNQRNYPKRGFQSSACNVWSCPYCNQNHVLYKCNKFNKLKPDAKLKTVLKLNVCKCCLYKHYDNPCTSTKKCKCCQGDHHTSLHDALNQVSTMPRSYVPTAPPNEGTINALGCNAPNNQHTVGHVATDEEEILLTTLSLQVKAADGTYIILRGLLDQGSQISLVSERAVQMLGLSRQRYHGTVSGIGNGSKQSRGIVSLQCKSIHDNFEFTTQALVISHVINNLPSMTFNRRAWPHIQHIQLADPEYNVSRPIDLLLDASVYSDIIMSGLIKGPSMAPIAQQTKLGWILSGNVKTFNCHVVINNLSDLSQYWELEDVNDNSPVSSPEEQYCEQLYQSTTTRLPDGRYQVALPMKPQFERNLGLSKSKAIAQFRNIENKMLKNQEFSNSYIQFMMDYENMGHMKRVSNFDTISCYLPHHGVLKSDSSTTKLRTVFNASSKTSSGFSLNELMERGPNLQKDLSSLIISWRQHKYVITADIEKMFRQILVRESDQHLQRIVWRASPRDPMTDYQLTTVTYGTKAAPYLAMRTLRQIALDGSTQYPLAAEALQNTFYMDDLLTGGETIQEARRLQLEIIYMLQGAGMNIRKWSSNAPELIKDLSSDQVDAPLDFRCSESRKTLGIRWNPKTDTFTFQNKFVDLRDEEPLTKRLLLGYISKIFDPLGWLSPLTIRAKLLFQKTWTRDNITWDDELSDTMKEEWNQLKLEFQNLNEINIPRYLGNKKHYVIHGFCDASEKAYSCTIYIVSKNDKGAYTSHLLTAKTKLAPLRHKITLPRLELCGALLLSRLFKKVMHIYPNVNMTINAWTDSMVVIGWIHGDVYKWKQFVANRVQQITSVIPSSNWHHVRSEQNAADCATRGLSLKQLSTNSLWWEGPDWLLHFDTKLISNKKYASPSIEIKKSYVNVALYDNNSFIIKLLNECSSITRLVTIVGWFLRYLHWLRDKQNTSRLRYLSVSEISHSYNLIIETVQHIEFQEDMHTLSKGESLKRTSKLLCLNPYIDSKDGLLRVGGRLNNSWLQQSSKHPIILPSHGRLTELIIHQAHLVMLHGGPSLTLAYIREKFWIVSGLRTVKRELRKCVKCRRFNSESNTQIMADLPEARVTPSRPFTHTGVDFTGYFEIKANKGRGVKTTKGYVAVFVCLATKAVHLELVSDLSTPGFLAAFRRFCARRGPPSHMYSDNGTNFVGANRVLKKEYKEILQTIDENFFKNTREFDIQWTFNAPAYPSAGGLWEAAVKRLKYHLRRVVGEQKLTYEEFITLLHQIEACLNSRPLIALTEDASDQYLTPGHFLVGGALISRPQTDPYHINLNVRWQMIQAMNKQIWKSWSSDYLQQLQVRPKWNSPRKNIEVNDIVLVKEDNLPPGKWALGKVTAVHPGKDGYVRVVSLRTENGEIKRPILKLSILPVREEPTSESKSEPTLDRKDDVTRRRNKRTPNCPNPIINAVTMLFLLFLTFISPAQSNYNVSNFNSDQSFYFDRVSELLLIRDEWKVVVYYNLTSYWRGLSDVRDYVTHLDTPLYTKNLPLQYTSILSQLQHDLSEIEHYNNLLRGNNLFKGRQKRGLINGVGYLANTLFGVLDERFLNKYERDITKLSLNENHIQLLIKNQTSVIEGQYNIMRRNEDIMNKQFSILDNNLRNIKVSINRLQSEVSSELNVLSSSLSASIIISSLRRIQDTIINTITDISHGHLNAHLLPPEQLADQVSIISSHLSGDLALPVDKQSVIDLYKMMKVSANIGNQYLIIEVRIPLVSKEVLELDRVFGLPHLTYSISSNFPYMAFNLQRNLLILLSETDIQPCLHLSVNRLLCTIDKPIYELRITKSICDININNKTMCITKQSACQERWIRLHSNNRWLFSCCESCLVRHFCPDGIQDSSLMGNGILDIGPGCTIKSNGLSIYGHSNNFHSQVNVQNDIVTVPKISILNTIINSSLDKSYIPEEHADQWSQLRAQIDDLKHESSTALSVHDVHHYSMLYTVLFLIILAVIIYVIMRYRTPKPRLQEELQGNNSIELRPTPVAIPGVSQPCDVTKLRDTLGQSLANINNPTSIIPVPSKRSATVDLRANSDSE